MLKIQNPFGDESDALSKLIHHHFENGHRVAVNSPNHHTNGHAGKIVDDSNDNRLEVLLDSGDTIRCGEGDLMPEHFAPASQSVKILRRALDSGAVSIHDRVRIEGCLEKVRTGNYSMSPFGELDYGNPFSILETYAQKYVTADTSEVLVKRAKSKFESELKIGDMVRDSRGRTAKITRVTDTHVDLDYGNGTTGTSLFGYLETA